MRAGRMRSGISRWQTDSHSSSDSQEPSMLSGNSSCQYSLSHNRTQSRARSSFASLSTVLWALYSYHHM